MSIERVTERLTSDQVAAVLRRAAELEAAEQDDTDPTLIDVAAVEQAAAEVGLSPTAVATAVAELRVGALTSSPTDVLRVPLLGPATVAEQRVVRMTSATAWSRINTLLRDQTFERRRAGPGPHLWRRREDFAARWRRRLDMTGRIKLKELRALTAMVTPVAANGRLVLVRVEADLANLRAGATAGSVAPPAVVAGGAGMVAVAAGEPLMLVVAGVGGLAVAAGSVALGRHWYQGRCQDVDELLCGLLDQLEPRKS